MPKKMVTKMVERLTKKIVMKMTNKMVKTYQGVSRQGGAGIHGVLGRHGAGLGGVGYRIIPHSWCS